MAKSHYLEKDRLANVIAAIQILGVSDQASATVNRWVAELEASEELTPEQLDLTPVKFADRKKWASVFEQHPEFFKNYTLRGEQRVLLRLRYAHSFSKILDKNGANAGTAERKNGTNEHPPIVSDPLSAEQLQVLINTAIELHDRAGAAERRPDRFSPLMMAWVGATLGAIAGGTIVVVLAWMQLTQMVRVFN